MRTPYYLPLPPSRRKVSGAQRLTDEGALPEKTPRPRPLTRHAAHATLSRKGRGENVVAETQKLIGISLEGSVG
jgi:hypothetical protein